MRMRYYCNKCKKRPKEIVEVYLQPLRERRRWNGEFYELQSSNIDSIGMVALCGKCDSPLVEK